MEVFPGIPDREDRFTLLVMPLYVPRAANTLYLGLTLCIETIPGSTLTVSDPVTLNIGEGP